MLTIAQIFGESPFMRLKAHGEKVHTCVRLLREAFTALEAGDHARLREVAERVFALETEADDLRNELHEQLAAKVLLPIRKEDLFRILEHQDTIADRVEDIVAIWTYRDLRLPPPLMAEVRAYLERILKNCELAEGIMSRLDLLIESAFSGRDALTVSELITELSQREDATKSVQIELTRRLLAPENQLPPVEALLWLQTVEHLADLSKHADRTGHGIRLTLQIKRPR